MAKAKSSGGSSKKKSPSPQESFGLPGKTYKVPADAVKTTSLPAQNKTKPLAGMQGPSNFKNRSNKEVGLAALMVTGAAVASKFTIASKTVVSEATKKLQRERNAVEKNRSSKGMSNLERQAEGEYRSEMTPSEYAEWRYEPKSLGKDISRSMKETNKKKIVIKKK